MAYLATPYKTAEIVKKYNFAFRKKFGQNFLINAQVLEDILDSAGVSEEDTVLEIGPGIGTMTQYLAERAGKVIAVEIDRSLLPILADTLSDYDNVKVINEDILKLDIEKLVKEENGGKPIKVVANLPYYITTSIIMALLERPVPLKSITIMVQKEVAERMQTGPGSKDYGALSLAVQYYADPVIVREVSPDCFMPSPTVTSTVIRLDRYSEPPVKPEDPAYMFRLIRASFNHRRKTLVNGLTTDPSLGLSKERVYDALEKMELRADIRGEKLTLEQYAELSDLLHA